MKPNRSLVPTRGLRHVGVLAAALLGLAALTPVCAATSGGGTDCAPMGSLPNYIANGAPVRYAYEQHEFLQPDSRVTVAGRYCHQGYDLKKGSEEMSGLEVLDNYKSQLDQLGAKIYEQGYSIFGVVTKDGKQTWVEVDARSDGVDTLVIDKQPVPQTLLPPSGNDYKLLGHMPNFIAGKPDKKHFDEHKFRVHSDDGDNDVNVQGTYYAIEYDLMKGAPEITALETQLNYRNALKDLGAKIMYASDDSTVARFDNKGQAIWMEINGATNLNEIDIYVIEEKAFQATIKPPQASALKTALDKDGHVALYINFDFDKATLRPDAAPVMAQVLALLKDNPGLKLSIVGNTDNVGGHDYNVKLSQARAATVVATLVKDGIAAARLKSSGDGPDKPIADNDTSAGRAKNRRVELVKS